MSIAPTILDVQEVQHEYGSTVLFFYTVTAQIDFPPNVPYPGDWIREEVSFPIGPVFKPSPTGLHLNPRSGAPIAYHASSVLAFPATFEVLSSRNPELGLTGWGVDTASTALDPTTDQVSVTALVVGKASASYFDRLRFLVIISGSYV